MKSIIFLILIFTFSSSHLCANIAINKDKDTYTYVRKEANNSSELVYMILENEIFFYNEDDMKNPDSDWVNVYIPKDKISFSGFENDLITGYVHKSRIFPLDSLPKYKSDDFRFEYSISKFDSTGRKISREKGYVQKIDDRPFWGTDERLPKTQVDIMEVSIDAKKIEIDQEFYSDIFECDNEFSVYKINDLYIVYQTNSDGAGSYSLAWVFTKEDGLVQRLIGNI